VENLDQIIIMGKIWLDYLHFNCKPNSNLKPFLKMKKFLAKENYDLIGKHFFGGRIED
jgi:hypothetical protein